ncbi:YHS domain-containing (seleno)protein [Roseofilum sp. BLCC_M154]|uniref:YHS domain-containing (Seleno)protein n=1 Tax=Roseofilum acuticapitatum BLCC-M154 TaxID=3022444 RepID=A0ABT7AV01_9CYAN|nr:YHS domain-containing (seleno)protein [Roseofilum acuticapitatum]MDJ1170690.1 YHS domain-containing (seleno)protein [Roseofilum acuticapitatum BLCC-M154]
MKLKYITTLAIASIFTVGITAHNYAQGQFKSSQTSSSLKACAGNPCAGNPCSGNPCAGNPCAGNPCAGNPCAGNPCAGKNPCAGNPCAGNPCAGATKHPAVFSRDGVAIRGADPVAYFMKGKNENAMMGNAEYQHQWNGTTWYFSSAENRDKFAANPSEYAPQYGGYCAKAMSEGNLAPVDPNAWTIYEGKLYLNYSKSVQAQWMQDIPGNITKANRHWPDILNR